MNDTTNTHIVYIRETLDRLEDAVNELRSAETGRNDRVIVLEQQVELMRGQIATAHKVLFLLFGGVVAAIAEAALFYLTR